MLLSSLQVTKNNNNITISHRDPLLKLMVHGFFGTNLSSSLYITRGLALRGGLSDGEWFPLYGSKLQRYFSLLACNFSPVRSVSSNDVFITTKIFKGNLLIKFYISQYTLYSRVVLTCWVMYHDFVRQTSASNQFFFLKCLPDVKTKIFKLLSNFCESEPTLSNLVPLQTGVVLPSSVKQVDFTTFKMTET